VGGADLGDQPQSERGVMRSLASSSVTFAAGVAHRHSVGGSATWLPQLSRVLRRMHRSIVVHNDGRATFAPHIDVRIASFGRSTSKAPLALRRDVVIASRAEHRPLSAQSAEPMIQRSSARAIRSDRKRDRLLGTSPVVATLLRRAAAVAEDASPSARDERSVRLSAQPQRPQQLSPVEVARLTDHIVHTIDRRISAFRERQGRR